MVDTSNFVTDRSAFTVRKPKLKPLYILLIAVISTLVILLTIEYNKPVFTIAVVIITLSLLSGLLYFTQSTTYDEKTATEFQSLIFSGAMRSNTLLTLIIHHDGSIFYLDPRYQGNFNKASQNHNLDQVLNTLGLESPEKIRIYDGIRDMTKTELEYVNSTGFDAVRLLVGVYPIQRPDGFVALCVMEA